MSRRKKKGRSPSPDAAAIAAPRRPDAARPSDPAVPPSVSPDATTEFSIRQKAVLFALLTIIYCVAGTWGQFDFSDMMGYYTMGADAARKGNLHIEYTPDKVNLIDMIPYQGRYYLQWGPLPIVFHLAARLAGLNLSDRVACLLAGLLASWLFFEILLDLRRRYFPGFPKAACVWFVFAFALATPAALVAWRGTVYNESIGLAALGIVAAFAAFLRYQQQPNLLWLALCGAGIGGAMLTRVSVALYAFPFFLALAAANYLQRRTLRTAISHLVVFSLPVVLAGLLQMAYNQARFGSPMDFGIRYKPETTDENFRTFDLMHVPENLGHYVFSLPKPSADFPWLDHTGWEPRVHTTFAEGMSSILLASPFLLLGSLVWRILKPGSEYPADLRLAAGLAAGSGLMMFAVMLCFVSASRRYVQDFMPLLMVAVFLGAATLSASTLRHWLAPAWVVVILSAMLHAHVSFYESFRSPQPDLNVTRAFIAVAPSIREIAPGPVLDQEEAMARNDWATVLLNRRRFQEALEQLERANELMPDSPVITKNLQLAQKLASRS
jgi:4-amino-4-deoxy-L-arabinose transferase-like glycosyltransferase